MDLVDFINKSDFLFNKSFKNTFNKEVVNEFADSFSQNYPDIVPGHLLNEKLYEDNLE